MYVIYKTLQTLTRQHIVSINNVYFYRGLKKVLVKAQIKLYKKIMHLII